MAATEPTTAPITSPLALLRMRDVVRRTGMSESSIRRAVAKDEFPTPLKIAARSAAFVEGEVDAWIRSRIAAQRGAA